MYSGRLLPVAVANYLWNDPLFALTGSNLADVVKKELSVMDLQTIMVEALDDERKSEATYSAIIERFGEVRPFINIVNAEARHSRAIERQMERLGMAVSENGWIGKGTAPATLAVACESAIAGEIENIALYDRLLPQIHDVTTRSVLETLQAASRDNHLPAFRRFLAREQGTTDGVSDARGPRGGRGYGRHENGGRDDGR